MFNTRLTLRKSAIWMRMVPNAIAFGCVATGSTKAKEHDHVAGTGVSVDRTTATVRSGEVMRPGHDEVRASRNSFLS